MIEARWSHHALSLRKVNVSPIPEQLLRFLRLSNEVGKRAISLEHHPFCVVMVASDHETVLRNWSRKLLIYNWVFGKAVKGYICNSAMHM
ncbi:hypothetical protein [Acinetobacter sp. ANC 3791]|uniref:hypothetical protein n=1 Tax=Acinetobacter sp. ANC 3791 TaxID=2529836 RepID=UPI001D1822A5|nr:hypothetical protein [Acinetobacter sp. ANC 3791]